MTSKMKLRHRRNSRRFRSLRRKVKAGGHVEEVPAAAEKLKS